MNLKKIILGCLGVLVLCIYGCQTPRKDFLGIWVPEYGIFPTIEIKNQSIIISSQTDIREFSYTITDNQIILNDSVGKWYGYPWRKNKETFVIKRISGDSLVLSSKEVINYDFLLIKNKLTKFKNFNRIQLYYSNSWNRSLRMKADSSGRIEIWEQNSEQNSRRYGIIYLNPEHYTEIVKSLNLLYSYRNIKLSGSCIDCETFGLLLSQKDSIKSFFVNSSSIHSIISRAILPLLGSEYKNNLIQTDTMKKIIYPKFFGCDTIIYAATQNPWLKNNFPTKK